MMYTIKLSEEELYAEQQQAARQPKEQEAKSDQGNAGA